MKESKEILGIIPARGGSKRIPRKNLYPLCGIPLIEYTFKAAKQSKYLSRIILSSDDREIISLARKNEIEAPFIRPADLAKDETPTLAVIQQALEYLEKNEKYIPQLIVILQPTSPLRKAVHIDKAVELLINTGADSVVSVVEVPHQYDSASLMKIEDGRLVSFSGVKEISILPRREGPKLYARNGAAVYALTYQALMKHKSIFGKDCRPLIMESKDSVDINTFFDLRLAEGILKAEKNGADQ